MSAAFNPQEILSRLRAKPTGGTNAADAVKVSSASSTGHSTQATASKVIKTPASLVLTATQRQENLTARLEMEKELKRLKDEVAQLKQENRQLREDKDTLQKHFYDYKVKNEETLVRLRAKIAKAHLIGPPVSSSLSTLEGNGKLYPPHGSTSHRVTPVGGMSSTMMRNAQTEEDGFRDPTFSELMRRSTAEAPMFPDSLRKQSTGAMSSSTGSRKSNPPHHFQSYHEDSNFVPPPPPPPPRMSSSQAQMSPVLYYPPVTFGGAEYDYREDLHRAMDDIPVVEIDLSQE